MLEDLRVSTATSFSTCVVDHIYNLRLARYSCIVPVHLVTNWTERIYTVTGLKRRAVARSPYTLAALSNMSWKQARANLRSSASIRLLR